jgi:hypothetical protein
MKTEQQRGDLSRTIRVQSNSVENSTILLLCGASMDDTFQIKPVGGVNFGLVEPGRGAEAEMVLRTQGGEPFSIRAIETGSKYVKAKVDTTGLEAGAAACRVKVGLLASTPKGLLDGRLTIRTNHPGKPVLNIPYRGEVVGPIRFSPETLFFGTDAVGASSSVTLEATGSGKFDLKNLSVSDGFSVAGGVQSYGKRYVITVTVTDPARIPAKPRLVIETNREEEPVISIPIRVENRGDAPETGKPSK